MGEAKNEAIVRRYMMLIWITKHVSGVNSGATGQQTVERCLNLKSIRRHAVRDRKCR